MANYPPPPYGAPFNTNGYIGPPIGAYNPSIPQHPYQQREQVPFFYGQSEPNGRAAAPNANSYSYLVNAHGVTPPVPGHPVNPTTFVGYGNQIYHGAVPQLPYPPAQIQSGASSYASQQLTTNSNTTSHPASVPPTPLNTQASAQAQHTDIRNSKHSASPVSELEDGEVNDGESDTLARFPEADEMGLSFSRDAQATRRENEYSPTTGASGDSNLSRPFQEDDRLNEEPRVTMTEQTYSSAPYPHQDAIQNGPISNPVKPSSDRIPGDATHIETPENGVLGQSKATDVSINTKWAEAKQALLDLDSQGFDFTQIVNKGLNPDILRKIYADVGISFTRGSPTQQGPTTHSKTATGNASTSIQADEVPTKTSNQQKVTVMRGKDNSNLDSKTSVPTGKEEKSLLPDSISLPKAAKPPTVNLPGKAIGTKAGDSKGVDRKEYIARLAAAKASVSSKTSAIPSAESPVQVTASRTPPALAMNQPSVESVTVRTLDADMEAKRKAQTELARQKIEALKRRESIQQESQIPNSSEGDRQTNGQLAGNRHESLFSGSATVPQPSLPSRQGSYFSPATQKPPFSIPGLFMTSDGSQSTIPHQLTTQTPATGDQRDVRTSFGPESHHPFSRGSELPSKSPVTTQATSIPRSTAVAEASPVRAVISSPLLTSRKRQKAADFIDSPSTRVKRPLGQQEDSSIIIDISEDDSSHVSDDDDCNMEIDERPLTTLKKTNNNEAESGKHKSIRDLPPLTDLPPRKKPSIMTPPAPQTPGPTKDPKGLKSKEMEIELMNRKIAELEQRRQAKRNTSRAQTPTTSAHVPISSPLREPSQAINDSSKALVETADTTTDVRVIDSTRQSPSASVDARRSGTEHRLTAEQPVQEIALPNAEAERSLALDAVHASAEDQGSQAEIFQASERQEVSSIVPEQNRHEDGEPVRPGLFAQQEPSVPPQGLRERDFDKIEGQDKVILRLDQEHMQSQEIERGLQLEQQKLLNEEQRLRKVEIEAGLACLDATVERTKQKLESLKKQILESEEEIQKKVESKKILMEEWVSLARPGDTSQAVIEQMDEGPSTVGIGIEQPSRTGREQVLPKSLPPVETTYESALLTKMGAIGIGQEHLAAQQNPPYRSASPAGAADEGLSDGELEEDIMDISRSDADEGEITDTSAEKAVVDQDSHTPVNEEISEISGDVVMSQQAKPDVEAPQPHSDDEVANGDMTDMAHDMSIANPSGDDIREEPDFSEGIPPNANILDEEKYSFASVSFADDSDADDYEPPEPASVEGDSALQPVPTNGSHSSLLPLDIDLDENKVPVHSKTASGLGDNSSLRVTTTEPDPNEQRAHGSSQQVGHFIPYESPLKQFKSYRYHPEYLKEVSQGFRSLTYSNTINPEIPLCRYELGGVCNDDSCQSQHLRGIGLNDDKILLDLGARPEGLSPQEQEDFTNGLKNIIHDIRSRKIRDFNIVASEVTAYRTKFLGDKSKVLPL